MRTLWRRARRFAGFVVVPALSLLTPLLVIPLVARNGGAESVIAVAVGQSVGFVGSLVVSLAWPMIGPPMIARLPPTDHGSVYDESVDSRLVVFALAGPAVAGVAAGLAWSSPLVAGFSALAITANGLTASWFYAGTGRPRGLLVNEAAVRIGAALLAAAALFLGAPIVAYPLLLCAGAVVSFLLNQRTVTGALRRPRLDRSALLAARSQWRVTTGRLVNGAFQAVAVSLVAAVAPAATLAFSGYDRTQKSLILASQAGVDGVISWVASAAPGLRRRQRTVLVADASAVAVLGLVFYVGLPPVLHYMYAGLIVVDPPTRVLAAVGLAAAVLSKAVLGHALVPSGHETSASALLAVTSVLGIAATTVGAAVAGVDGALTALVLAEATFSVAGLVLWSVRPAVPSVAAAPVVGAV